MEKHYFVGVCAELRDEEVVGRDEYYLIEAWDEEEARDTFYKYLDGIYYEFEYDILEEIEYDIAGIVS